MPKLIDYPRTTYAGAWELAEIVDDTGGKCAVDTAARKLNRKVSGSFKAIIGSAVKFGLMTSKRDLLTTTTLFKRIKHAYDKQEELLFHREAFLTPPLFTQLCRKFRNRELPVQMLDVMLIREFGVEEINAQGVAKAFTEGCRMVGLLDERNIIADIDALAAQRSAKRELATPQPQVNSFRTGQSPMQSEGLNGATNPSQRALNDTPPNELDGSTNLFDISAKLDGETRLPAQPVQRPAGPDAIASLFGLLVPATAETRTVDLPGPGETRSITKVTELQPPSVVVQPRQTPFSMAPLTTSNAAETSVYQLQVSGPGVNTSLSITEEEDITIAIALLEKIRRQLKSKQPNGVS